ncbi:MAG: GIY-YIG nuclease family protein [Candidatus Nanosynbacter sp.]|nr:GIY-YIG nuclease family protein [Candidatus Nanosynbacter sp.]
MADDWCRALRSRKGVYLITDKNTGKQYVGSAYGEDGILGRWSVYLKSGYAKNEKENNKYPNKKLKELVKEKGLKY